jgi:hypothetical protein
LSGSSRATPKLSTSICSRQTSRRRSTSCAEETSVASHC